MNGDQFQTFVIDNLKTLTSQTGENTKHLAAIFATSKGCARTFDEIKTEINSMDDKIDFKLSKKDGENISKRLGVVERKIYFWSGVAAILGVFVGAFVKGLF